MKSGSTALQSTQKITFNPHYTFDDSIVRLIIQKRSKKEVGYFEKDIDCLYDTLPCCYDFWMLIPEPFDPSYRRDVSIISFYEPEQDIIKKRCC